MSEIQGGRWQDFMRRMFSLKQIAAQHLSEELVGTVAAIPPRPEDCILRGDKLYHVRAAGTTAAGNRSHVNLRNDSEDCLVTLEHAFAYEDTGAAGVVQVRMGNTAVGTGPATVSGRDTRLGITLAGRGQAGQVRYGHVAAASGTYVQRIPHAADFIAVVRTPLVLHPGAAVFLWAGQDNVVIQGTFLWRERLAEPGELSY